jgi:quercetin dioxygenase-like cupin family protein
MIWRGAVLCLLAAIQPAVAAPERVAPLLFHDGVLDAWRAFTGEDGETHFQRIHLSGKKMQEFGIADAVTRLYADDAISVVLIVGKPGFQSPAHNVGAGRELGLVVRGSATAFYGKGESHVFRPGDLTLFEDTGSKGRSVRFGPDGYVGLTVPLAN